MSERAEIAAKVMQSEFTYTLNEGCENPCLVTIHKMSWPAFARLKDVIAEVINNAKPPTSSEGAASDTIMLDFVKMAMDSPFQILVLLIQGCVDFTQKNIPPLDEWAFDDVLGVGGAILETHFLDNQKLHSFFTSVGRVLQLAPLATTEMRVIQPPTV